MLHYTPETVSQMWFPHLTVTQSVSLEKTTVSIELPITKAFYDNHGTVIKGIIEEIPYVKSILKKVQEHQARIIELEAFKDSCKEVFSFLSKE